MKADTSLSKVTADLKSGRYNNMGAARVADHVRNVVTQSTGPLIDATFIYKTYLQRDQVALYEDHPDVRSPWPECFVGYRNQHGNAIVTFVMAMPWRDEHADITGWAETAAQAGNSLDGAVSRLDMWTFAGGFNGEGKAVATHGPMALTQIALAESGRPLDVHWIDLLGATSGQPIGDFCDSVEGVDRPAVGDDEVVMHTMKRGLPQKYHDPAVWDWPRWTTMGVFTVLACRNIELVQSPLPRAARRREERQGVRSYVLAIQPTGKRYARDDEPKPLTEASQPLHSVRGHVRHHGACCGDDHPARGKLFGKLTCKIWVPYHVRGSAEHGETEQTFVVTK